MAKLLLPQEIAVCVPAYCRCKYKLVEYRHGSFNCDDYIQYVFSKPCSRHKCASSSAYKATNDAEYCFNEKTFIRAYKKKLVLVSTQEILKMHKRKQSENDFDISWLEEK